MCGIVGSLVFNQEQAVQESLLRAMATPLHARGPDQEGFWISTTHEFSCGLAHKRLSIIDVTDAGKQPMTNASDSLALVFNGEIYNYRNLKYMLQQQGCTFVSSSDTEVLLHAYETWGMQKTLENIEGMFAFALFDKKLHKMFLARDRFGEKPLYYASYRNGIAFSSDLRSFKPLNLSRNISHFALGYYFSELTTPSEQSIFEEIRKVPPSNFVEIGHHSLEVKPYWELTYNVKSNLSIKECIAETESLLENAVKNAMVSDVPLGCFLSGGIDSSLVSYFAAKNYSRKLPTFCAGFEYEPYNELPFAREVSRILGTEHHEIVINPSDFSAVDSILMEYGEPFADSSAIPSFYLAKFARNSVKVVLGGDGGDEVFAGYRTYNQGKRMQQWHNAKAFQLPLSFLHGLTKNDKMAYWLGIMRKNPKVLASALHRSMGFTQEHLGRLFHNVQLQHALEKEHEKIMLQSLEITDTVFDAVLHASLRTRLPNDYLVKTDRASMANSLELRSPFLDKSLLEFSAKLPYNLRMPKGENKFLTKKLAEQFMPSELIHRKKQGFGIPIGQWIKKEWKNRFKATIFEPNPFIEMDSTFVSTLWEDHLAGRADHTHRLWTLYVWNLWSSQQ